MLNENIRTMRKAKGLSQEELAIRLNVVRQTVSKWENGISIPDAEMLISISEALETPVHKLLGENIANRETDRLTAISEKLEIVNMQLAQRKETKRKILHYALIIFCVIMIIIFAILAGAGNGYLNWDYSNPETAVMGVGVHAFEWLFIRVAPIILVIAVFGIVKTRKRK